MSKRIVHLLHVAIWAMLFLSPLTFMRHDEGFQLEKYLMMCMAPLLLMVVFYTNYLWLVPKHFFSRSRQTYWVVNALLVSWLGVFTHYWLAWAHNLFDTAHHVHYELSALEVMVFILRDMFNLAVAAAVATAIALASRIHHSEEARLEAEAARADAELSNLRNQISPHFLLNTLNNIYALTAFDQERAQQAIDQLSRLLRHMLYGDQQQPVALRDEVQFLESYVSLMRLRLSPDVEVTFDTHLDNPEAPVAPLIFISLVENAFKHGVSPTGSSFIHIAIGDAPDGTITCDIENSNHPKTDRDHSGHGIGLQQVQRRLELSYPGRHQWQHGPSADGRTYHSRLLITPQQDKR